MSDNKTKEQRSQNMAAIRSISKLESHFSKAIWNRGIRFRRNVKKLFGSPDIAIQKYKIVIFIDSCFWHACPSHFKRPKSNQKYWDTKIQKNVDRDLKVTRYYIDKGWHIKRIWEHNIKNNFEQTLEETIQFIQSAKKNNN